MYFPWRLGPLSNTLLHGGANATRVSLANAISFRASAFVRCTSVTDQQKILVRCHDTGVGENESMVDFVKSFCMRVMSTVHMFVTVHFCDLLNQFSLVKWLKFTFHSYCCYAQHTSVHAHFKLRASSKFIGNICILVNHTVLSIAVFYRADGCPEWLLLKLWWECWYVWMTILKTQFWLVSVTDLSCVTCLQRSLRSSFTDVKKLRLTTLRLLLSAVGVVLARLWDQWRRILCRHQPLQLTDQQRQQ